MRNVIFLLVILFLSASFSSGHDTTVTSANIALEEKLGAFIPAGTVFRDEEGRTVDLRAFADRPTIIAPVYFHCQHVCPLLLMGLASALGKVDFVEPGRDFRVVALSFDERETPALAREKKPNYLTAVGRPFPADAWTFLTGDGENIRKFTDATGFRFQRDGADFSHPLTLIVLAPGGRVARYMDGTRMLPFQVTMAVTEAAQGRISSPAGRALNYCFSYDTKKGAYAFNVLKVVGAAMILTVAGFFAYLMAAGKRADR